MQPQKGTIEIDGVALDNTNISAWQKGVSHVPQAIFLSDASIAENVAFGIPHDQIDIARVKASLQMAQLDDFIQTLPNTYNEKVGERGVRLSGGQRQRIGIARALYTNPSLIVFDEATSALDNKTENDVMSAINELRQSLTIILIAHRLSTIQNADNIILLGQGRILAQGTYAELLTNADFKALVNATEATHDLT
jgi:ATP-binding cassette subfamily B protein